MNVNELLQKYVIVLEKLATSQEKQIVLIEREATRLKGEISTMREAKKVMRIKKEDACRSQSHGHTEEEWNPKKAAELTKAEVEIAKRDTLLWKLGSDISNDKNELPMKLGKLVFDMKKGKDTNVQNIVDSLIPYTAQ